MDLIEDENIIKIKEVWKDLLDDDKNVFKSCQKDWIVVLRKMPETLTNEGRKVVNEKFAKYRGSLFNVINIFNKFNPTETREKITNSMFDLKTVAYIVGTNVIAKDYVCNDNIIYGGGFHYFKSVEPAYYAEICNFKYLHSNEFTGKKVIWLDNGMLYDISTYVKGRRNGVCYEWTAKNEKIIYNYVNGIKHGVYEIFHQNGEKIIDGYYRNNVINTRWNENSALSKNLIL
uniref:MORN repeat protein n=1 Tax=viral metagenome TaxID=1070528 RepID=A0A6C0EAT8_9ZZZZ